MTRPASPLPATIAAASSAMPDASMATTQLPADAAGPAASCACAVNMLRMPVPQPTSSTALPANHAGLRVMASRYASVRTASRIISAWMPACA